MTQYSAFDGSDSDVRDRIAVELLARTSPDSCVRMTTGSYDYDVLVEQASEFAQSTPRASEQAGDFAFGPRDRAGESLTGGELLATSGPRVAWFALPDPEASIAGAKSAAVAIQMVQLADGREVWWRGTDSIVAYESCPEHEEPAP